MDKTTAQMRRFHARLAGRGLIGWLPLALAIVATPARPATPPEISDLIGQFIAADQKPLLLRWRVAVRPTGGREEVTQVLIKRRRDGDVVRVLHQVLWPAAREGEALYFEASGRSERAGFVLKRGAEPRPLADVLGEPYLDSDFDVEDLVTNFWQWPVHDWVGEGYVEGDRCWIVASRPERPMPNGCAAVRSWISASKLISLQTEFLDHEGRVLKTAVVKKTTRFEGHWAPVITQVKRAGGRSETTVEIVRAERGREIPLEEFSLDALRKKARQ